MLQVLRTPDYARLWLGQTISQLGDQIRKYAMTFWIFQQSGHSPLIFTAAFIAATLPDLLLGPVAGVLVDRWDRRKVMIASDLSRSVLSLALVLVALAGQYLWALPLVFLAEVASQFFDPARAAMNRRIVSSEQLLAAASLAQSTRQVLKLSGPALGTAIYLALGPVASFSADALSFFLSAICIATIRTSGALPARSGGGRFWDELWAGLRYAWQSPVVRALFLTLAALFAAAGAVNSLFLFILKEGLGLSDSAVAVADTFEFTATLVAVAAVGSIAGRIRRVPLLVPLGLVLGAAGFGLVAAAPNMAVLLCGCVLIGLDNAVMNVGLGATMQAFVPDEMQGRIQGLMGSLPTAVLIGSSAAAGSLATVVNPRYILGGAALLTALAAVVAFRGLRGLRLPARVEQPAEKPAEAAPAGG